MSLFAKSIAEDPQMTQNKPQLVSPPLISSNFVSALFDYLKVTHRVDSEEFLRKLNLDKDSLVENDTMLPMSTFMMLMEGASAYVNDPDLGLHYYENFDFKELGIFGYAQLNSKNLGSAFAVMGRYYSLIQNDSRIFLTTEEKKAQVTYQITAKNLPYSRQDSEMTIAAVVAMVRQLVDKNWRPDEIHFQHSAPPDTSEHKRILGPHIYFDKPVNKVVFDKALLDKPISNADVTLSRSLTETLEQLLKLNQLPSEDEWLTTLQDQIVDSLSNGVPTIDIVAGQLGMCGRTLQRKLAQEGVNFKGLVENVRHQLAINYLNSSDWSLQDIAFLLGYSELSSFIRAFKRWTDCSPLEYRKLHRVMH